LLFLLVLSLFLVFNFSVQPAQAFDSGDIFFEYGAESGELQPPWDKVGASGSGSTEDAYVAVDTTHVRTGNYSMLIHQPPPTKSDAQRRVHALYYSHTQTDFYASWWMFYPSDYEAGDITSGGLTLYWRNKDTGWSTNKGLRLRTRSGDDGSFYDRFSWSGIDDENSGTPAWNRDASGDPWGINGHRPWVWDANKVYIAKNQWHHYQVYMKVSTGTNADGAVGAWIDGNEVMDQTNIPTNPSYWGYPASGETYNDGISGPYYKINLEQYGDRDKPEINVWYDDVVGSLEEVPASYRVEGVNPSFEPFSDGFESGDFSYWNSTDYHDGGFAPSVTSTEQYSGIYSANFTVDGSTGSTSRANLLVQNTSEVYMRSHVWYSELPDTNNTRVMCIRADTPDSTYIASAGVYRLNANYYWCIRHTSGGNPPQNYTLATINPQTWYTVDFYVNVTVNGNFSLWVDETFVFKRLVIIVLSLRLGWF